MLKKAGLPEISIAIIGTAELRKSVCMDLTLTLTKKSKDIKSGTDLMANTMY
jgi:hypothetical protein